MMLDLGYNSVRELYTAALAIQSLIKLYIVYSRSFGCFSILIEFARDLSFSIKSLE